MESSSLSPVLESQPHHVAQDVEREGRARRECMRAPLRLKYSSCLGVGNAAVNEFYHGPRDSCGHETSADTSMETARDQRWKKKKTSYPVE